MTRARAISIALILSACGGSPADGDAGHAGGGACGEIVEHCHSVGSASAEADECHELGHDGPEESCELRRAECIGICDAIAVDAGPPDSCETISHVCHAFDTGSGPAHVCHELGHAGDLAACDGALAMCMSTCSGDAGARSHDEDGGAHTRDEDAGASDGGSGHSH